MAMLNKTIPNSPKQEADASLFLICLSVFFKASDKDF